MNAKALSTSGFNHYCWIGADWAPRLVISLDQRCLNWPRRQVNEEGEKTSHFTLFDGTETVRRWWLPEILTTGEIPRLERGCVSVNRSGSFLVENPVDKLGANCALFTIFCTRNTMSSLIFSCHLLGVL